MNHIVTMVVVKVKEPKSKEGHWLVAAARPMVPVPAPAAAAK
jgi:hypothetical protein